jgi:hypothetical protein
MRCPYCDNELKKGTLDINSNSPILIRRFTKENCEIKGIKGLFAANKSNVYDCSRAFCCSKCKIVFGEFKIMTK